MFSVAGTKLKIYCQLIKLAADIRQLNTDSIINTNETEQTGVKLAAGRHLQNSATTIWNNKVNTMSLTGEAKDEADQSRQTIDPPVGF